MKKDSKSELSEAARIMGRLAAMPHKPHKIGKKVLKKKPTKKAG